LNAPPPDPLASFGPLLDALADRIVDRWLASTSSRMVAQAGSPLGTRVHRNAVKRRLANGEGGAAITDRGRRFMLTHEALQEELGLRPPPSPDRDVKPGKPSQPKPGGKSTGPSGSSHTAPRDRVSDFQADLLKKLRGGK
jgi:hypothetical protein